MTSAKLIPSERKYQIQEWNKHLTGIIAAEIARRKLTIRFLVDQGIIKTRSKFNARLENSELWSGEMEALIKYLEIDIPLAMLAFLTNDPIHAYRNGIFENVSRLTTSFVDQYNQRGFEQLPFMEPLRKPVIDSLASKMIDQFVAQQHRVDTVRNSVANG